MNLREWWHSWRRNASQSELARRREIAKTFGWPPTIRKHPALPPPTAPPKATIGPRVQKQIQVSLDEWNPMQQLFAFADKFAKSGLQGCEDAAAKEIERPAELCDSTAYYNAEPMRCRLPNQHSGPHAFTTKDRL